MYMRTVFLFVFEQMEKLIPFFSDFYVEHPSKQLISCTEFSLAITGMDFQIYLLFFEFVCVGTERVLLFMAYNPVNLFFHRQCHSCKFAIT